MQTRTRLTRLIFGIVLLISVINGWWFIIVPLGILGLWIFPYYVEFIVAGLGYDAIFGLTEDSVSRFIGLIVTLVISLIVVFLKKFLR